jgi:hypothetical protein
MNSPGFNPWVNPIKGESLKMLGKQPKADMILTSRQERLKMLESKLTPRPVLGLKPTAEGRHARLAIAAAAAGEIRTSVPRVMAFTAFRTCGG